MTCLTRVSRPRNDRDQRTSLALRTVRARPKPEDESGHGRPHGARAAYRYPLAVASGGVGEGRW